MPAVIDDVRRSVTQRAIRGFLAAAGVLPPPAVRLLAQSVGRAAAATIPLRSRLAQNLALGLGPENVPAGSAGRYFRNFANLAECQAQVFCRGIDAIDLGRYVRIGPSIENLDAAVTHGKGVILAAPHLFGHELGAGVVNRRHRVVALVRESANPQKQRLKDQWYAALGVETVIRRRSATALWDLQACLRILRSGAILGITPDLLVGPQEGVPITAFGRRVFVKPGMAALAMYSGAPIVTSLGELGDDGVREATFTSSLFHERPRDAGRDRAALNEATRRVMQDWFAMFESFLNRRPEDWLFWLDKRWTQALRQGAQIEKDAAWT